MSSLPRNRVCDVVAERVALGEPLGDAADHAASCARCRRLAALPAELGATHREADPGVGFAARMTAGAQRRVIVRRRRRIATATLAAGVASTLMVFALTRHGEAPRPPAPALDITHDDPDVVDDADAADDIKALVQLADTDRSRHYSARWREIQKPLRPYQKLVKGVEP